MLNNGFCSAILLSLAQLCYSAADRKTYVSVDSIVRDQQEVAMEGTNEEAMLSQQEVAMKGTNEEAMLSVDEDTDTVLPRAAAALRRLPRTAHLTHPSAAALPWRHALPPAPPVVPAKPVVHVPPVVRAWP